MTNSQIDHPTTPFDLCHRLVGDSIYIKGAQKCPLAVRDTLLNFPRQALHAERLGLEHPATGEWMEWQVGMPSEMKKCT